MRSDVIVLPEPHVDDDDVLPKNWTVLSWNFPFMIPVLGEGEFHEEVEVHGCADRVCPATGE